MINHINSFSKINPVKPNTLVVLDIDDTIMSFSNIHKEWWNETYTNLYYYDKENIDSRCFASPRAGTVEAVRETLSGRP
jgi:hypothetical protein